MEQFTLQLDELPILLNILYYTDNEVFRIHPYLLGDDIFKISLGKEAQITRLISQETYLKKIEKISEFSEITPSFGLIRQILLGSGIWPYQNWSEIQRKLDEVISRNPLCGDRMVMIGFDTNCFINRLYSCIKLIYKQKISRFGFILSKIVRSELMAMKKIKEVELNKLQETLKQNRDIFSEFWNQDTLSTRIRHLGLVEFNKLRTQSNYIINDGIIIDGREKDLQIIEDYQNQIERKNSDILLISSDQQFYDQARGPGILSHYLEIPPLKEMPNQFSGTWEQVCDFIYLLSIVFGVISVRAKDSIQLFGIWRGKKGSEWDSESINIRIGSSRIIQLLKQQLNILAYDR